MHWDPLIVLHGPARVNFTPLILFYESAHCSINAESHVSQLNLAAFTLFTLGFEYGGLFPYVTIMAIDVLLLTISLLNAFEQLVSPKLVLPRVRPRFINQIRFSDMLLHNSKKWYNNRHWVTFDALNFTKTPTMPPTIMEVNIDFVIFLQKFPPSSSRVVFQFKPTVFSAQFILLTLYIERIEAPSHCQKKVRLAISFLS